MPRSVLASRVPVRTAATAAGVALGIAAELSGYLPHPWEYLSQLAGPWLVLAFAVGRLCRRGTAGLACGVAVILLGLGAYALFKTVAYGTDSVRPLLAEWPFWVALAVALGGPSGAAGALTRSCRRVVAVLAWSVPIAVLLAEAAAIVAGFLPWTTPLALAEFAAALMTATWAARYVRAAALALGTLVLTAVAIALVPLVQFLSPVS